MKSFIAAATALVPFSAIAQIDGDEHWFYDYPNLSAEPFVFETIGDYIYAGGLFLTVGGAPDAKDFARWNLTTETWEAIPDFGANDVGGVWAIHAGDEGSVFIGGNFSAAGGFETRGVARLNPSTLTWSALRERNRDDGQENGPTNGRVRAIEQIGDWIYVGGEFTGPPGTPTAEKYIRRYNLATEVWELSVGGGLTSVVWSLVELPDGSLLAGGDFPGGLARFDGTSWSIFAGGVDRVDNSGIQALVREIQLGPDGSLYIGGEFNRAGSAAVRVGNIAKIDPAGNWDTLGGGFDDAFIFNGSSNAQGVFGLRVGADGRIFAGGDFDADVDRVNRDLRHVAVWDGTAWNNLGSGVGFSDTQNVNCLTLGPDGDVYVGGLFGKGFNTASARFGFARWDAGFDFTDYIPGALAASRTGEALPVEGGLVEVTAVLRDLTTYVMESGDLDGTWTEVTGSSIEGAAGRRRGFNFTQRERRFYRFRPVSTSL